MWRNEERLAFWLDKRDASQKSSRRAWLGKLHSGKFKAVVRGGLLDIRSRTISLDDAIPAANVLDGLGQWAAGTTGGSLFGAGRPGGAFEGGSKLSFPLTDPACPSPDLHEAELLPAAGVRHISMPEAQEAAISSGTLIPTPNVRRPAIAFDRGRVRSVEPFRNRPVKVNEGRRMLIGSPSIRVLRQISRFPHRRTSVNPEMLKDAERRSFLHEAEVLKQVPIDNAELLAVFRNIPVELISRLRFLGGRKEILYSISIGPNRTRTRVHDVAAIRDKANQEVHLIPHRTQSRQVHLA